MPINFRQEKESKLITFLLKKFHQSCYLTNLIKVNNS